MEKTHIPHAHLKAWREAKGLSQEAVADILGLDRSQVHRWETGKRNLHMEDLRRLAEIYGVPFFALVMSPDNLDVAKMLAEAHDILKSGSPEAVAAWLAMGKAMLGTHSPPP